MSNKNVDHLHSWRATGLVTLEGLLVPDYTKLDWTGWMGGFHCPWGAAYPILILYLMVPLHGLPHRSFPMLFDWGLMDGQQVPKDRLFQCCTVIRSISSRSTPNYTTKPLCRKISVHLCYIKSMQII